ncbi:tyrosine-protein phosphatase [Clostridium polynesiense]|uniref:tyrosine-protein phosphatase n=1 Tax=Clostridium polynesiense TaxID=1325933 RepID=UPI0011C952B6|nr:CpsB/CapC family capsule biosynthesis tyrosine phosphatase [Clostridium polynesiense]
MERVSRIQMIDFHSHIMWGVDDGSKDIEMSGEMVKNSILQEVAGICATPHFIIDEQEIDADLYYSRLNKLKELYGRDINILSGLEIYINPNIPKYYKEKKIWGLNNSRYVLIELPMRDYPVYTQDVFHELLVLGAIPVIAHPERNFKIQKDIKLLEEILEQGALAQLNAGSICGMFGEAVKNMAEVLVKRNMIHIIGSDGHNNHRRRTDVISAFQKVKNINPELYRWMDENNYNIINDLKVEVPEIQREAEKKNSFLNLFLRKKK